jgi:transposase
MFRPSPFFGGVPLSILYDNTKLAVAICGDGKRERTRAFTGLISHYLFRDRFGRPGKGKVEVEGLVKNGPRRFLTPIPVAASFEALNATEPVAGYYSATQMCERTLSANKVVSQFKCM